MHRFFHVTAFLLVLLLATTHGGNVPNSLHNHAYSGYSSTASIEPRALLLADRIPTTTATDAMATPLVARDNSVTESSDMLYIPNLCTLGLVVVATMTVSAGSSSTGTPDSKGHGKVNPKYCGDSTIFAHLSLC
ncbi:hypothetical protein BPOR_0004g00450 [Botrytis porri]|uniref:Uncharacterized protein n=1 Tax=Botrytis porri TaxID=87229 RepID=A0A4Z1L6A6_9HELO|nr:hypothetical protein BPOR_0004g00450 [Botrytis porri]